MKSSIYKGVSSFVNKARASQIRRGTKWAACYNKNDIRWRKACATEREAAIAYDMKMIELGLDPVNILKKK